MTTATTARYWWQNDTTWTTRSGDIIPVEQLGPKHRAAILEMVATPSWLKPARRDMGWTNLLLGCGAPDEATDELEREADIIQFGDDEEILARMPLVMRLRELAATEAGEAETAAETAARVAAAERRAAARARRVDARAQLNADIAALVSIAAEYADRATLTRIRENLAAGLTSDGTSYLGVILATDSMKEWKG